MRRRALAAGVAIVAAALLITFPLWSAGWESSRYATTVLRDMLVLGILALSLDVLVGTSGLPSLGHAAFFGAGAYAAAVVTQRLGTEQLAVGLAAAVMVSALLALVIVPLLLTLGREIPRWARVVRDVVFVAVGVGIAATFAYAGHGATGRLTYVALPADMIHILAAATWFGGLVVLAVALRDTGQPQGAARATDRGGTGV